MWTTSRLRPYCSRPATPPSTTAASRCWATGSYPGLPQPRGGVQPEHGPADWLWPERATRPLTTRLALIELLQTATWPGWSRCSTPCLQASPRLVPKNQLASFEGLLRQHLYSYFAALGLDIRLEDTTNHGRIDMAVLFNGEVLLFEFKVVELTRGQSALAQIKRQGLRRQIPPAANPSTSSAWSSAAKATNVVGLRWRRWADLFSHSPTVEPELPLRWPSASAVEAEFFQHVAHQFQAHQRVVQRHEALPRSALTGSTSHQRLAPSLHRSRQAGAGWADSASGWSGFGVRPAVSGARTTVFASSSGTGRAGRRAASPHRPPTGHA